MSIRIDHSIANTASSSLLADSKRLRQLVAVHLVLGLTPVTGILFPLHEASFLPIIVALFSIPLGQIMLLSFWVGMGTSKVVWRLLGGLLGSAYLAAPPILFSILLPGSTETRTAERPSLSLYVAVLVTFFGLVLAFGGEFWLMRRWHSELCRIHDPGASARPRFQFSILLHPLALTTAAAIGVGVTRNALSGTVSGMEEPLALLLFLLVVFFIDSLWAAGAALGTEPFDLRVFLVCIAAILLGVALAVAMRPEPSLWWLVFRCCVIATSVPTVIVIVSLLVVRSCGYRLIRKRAAFALDAQKETEEL